MVRLPPTGLVYPLAMKRAKWTIPCVCLALPLIALSGCSGPKETVSVSAQAGCEWLLPDHCALPWPSNRFAVSDEATETGLRLRYRMETMPASGGSDPFQPAPWNRLDGFSASGTMLVSFNDVVDIEDLPGHRNIGASLEADSPTVVIDASTGERVAHWAELDAGAMGPDGEWVDRSKVLLYLRSAERLKEATRYVVALRGLGFENGEPVPVSPAFRALRDDLPTDNQSVERRREEFEEIFDILEGAGVGREDLLLAWDFTTVSGDSLRRDLLHMRDDAVARLGDKGIGCEVLNVDSPWREVYARVEGTFTVPSYMDSASPPALLARDEDGMPKFQEMVEVDFSAIIPNSLAEEDAEPGKLITYGHGLMGSRGEATGGSVRRMAELHEAVVVATNWAGMAGEDVTTLIGALTDVSDFDRIAERLHQGMINQLALARTMAGVCAESGAFDVEGRPTVDPEKTYWIGISQGGIFGATVMAISPDIHRGVLHVGGANYAMMVERSSNYEGYEVPFEMGYPTRMDRQLLLAVIQQLWDFTDPISWLINLEREPLEGMPPKEVLYSVALHDAQVPNLSSDLAVRTAGFPLLVPSVVEPWGIPVVEAPVEGSAYVYFDVGDPPPPETNATPEEDPGGHGRMRGIEEHLEMVDVFLREGTIIHPCDGPCVF